MNKVIKNEGDVIKNGIEVINNLQNNENNDSYGNDNYYSDYDDNYNSGCCRTKDVYKSTAKDPITTLCDRILPRNVISICLTFLERSVGSSKVSETVVLLKKWQILETLIERLSPSFMSERFHPPINADWITTDIRDAEWLKKKCSLSTSLPHHLVSPDDVNTL